ncbi:MAG: hypothetical protein SVR81_05130 [Chloroflexota bacterium]|nr:hypothetical protein [Chloroflexota bacterium]
MIWFTGITAADTPVALDTVTVDLWPKLDQPGLTVFYEISLAEDVAPSQNIHLRIPTNVDVLLLQNGD